MNVTNPITGGNGAPRDRASQRAAAPAVRSEDEVEKAEVEKAFEQAKLRSAMRDASATVDATSTEFTLSERRKERRAKPGPGAATKVVVGPKLKTSNSTTSSASHSNASVSNSSKFRLRSLDSSRQLPSAGSGRRDRHDDAEDDVVHDRGQSDDPDDIDEQDVELEEEAGSDLSGTDDPGLINVFDTWAKDSSSSAEQPLEMVRIGYDACHILFFTPEGCQVRVHYAEEEKAYVHCNGNSCMMCRVGKAPQIRHLLPVYEVAAGKIGVLSILYSKNPKPGSLKVQLEGLKPTVNGQRLVAIRKVDDYRFAVVSEELAEDFDDGTKPVAKFVRQMEAGKVNLRAVYRTLTNAQMAELDGVANLIKVRRDLR